MKFIFPFFFLSISVVYGQTDQVKKKSFKALLKEKQLSLEIGKANKYESFQDNNTYTNHYFGVTTDFPDGWEKDRGMSEFSICRALNRDSSATLTLMCGPLNLSKTDEVKHQKVFQVSPLDYMKKLYGADFRKSYEEEYKNSSTLGVYDFKLEERKVRNVNYLVISYRYDERTDNQVLTFKAVIYQTILWGTTYTITYIVPELYFREPQLNNVLRFTNYINPNN